MKHDIYNYIKENREEAIAILSTLPDNRLKLIQDLGWGSIDMNGVLSDKDIERDELRDLPSVIICDERMYEVIVLDIFLYKGNICFTGAMIDDNNNIVPELQEYNIFSCALYMENILYEAIDDYLPKSEI